MSSPFSGLRVLELGSFIAVPFAAKLLADLGADVLKVEPPEGEMARDFGPFRGDTPDPEKSGLALYMSANKRSVTLDYSTPTGNRLFRDLVRRSDLLLCDLQTSALAELRLGYDDISGHNPGLIMTSVTPFGLTGPYSDFLGCDMLAFHATGTSDRYLGLADREPLRAMWYLTDHWTGLNAAGATIAAYIARLRDGKGQHIDISSTDCVAAMVNGYQPLSVYYDTGATSKRNGYTLTFTAPVGLFPCADGHVYLAALNPKQWDGLAKSMGNPEWASSPIFTGTAVERMQYADELYALMAPWLMKHTKEELFALCQGNGTPVTPAYTAADLNENAHLAARGFFETVDDPYAGRLKLPGAPYKMSASPWSLRNGPSRLGEHNVDVYCGALGLSRGDLVDLRRAGVV